MPATSVLNFVPGQTVANFVTLGLGPSGVCLAASAPVQVVGDLMGWFTGSDDFASAPPTRLLDTRVTKDALEAGVERRLPLSAGAGYPGRSGAVALNVTIVSPAADGLPPFDGDGKGGRYLRSSRGRRVRSSAHDSIAAVCARGSDRSNDLGPIGSCRR
jgi:hypothetical protein